ncbi:crocetin glucosyltransferase, chloroplastic-like [Rhododendron vialii]|uniref:crocetin glucosyltransferase, chloroplastic-like n=1 Tax=Rhododendron vialii TaxID=182163 RepID=UPI00265E7AEA|nr:crocetin glucosyltransferase, chloroplastic-like [Rhododendron vialii]
MDDERVRVLLVTFPAQGHINPSLQFARCLTRMGVDVTLLTALSAINRITKTTTSSTPQGVTYLGFSDGYDDGLKVDTDFEVYMADLRRRGSEAVAKLVTFSGENGKPFVHVVYTILLSWVSQVTRALNVPSTFLWIQPAAILDIYYYSFYGYGDVIRNNVNDPSWSVELPGLPRLTGRDLPSFLCAPNLYKFALSLFKEHIDTLGEETNPKVLVNSFDALESEALRAIKKLNFVAIGPLIPSAFLDRKDPSDNSFGGDLLQKSNNYIEWLDSKPRGSVIYVAFGSISELAKQQTEEVARGLLDCERPFLWVMRGKGNDEKEEDKVGYKEELERQGMIVSWCSQVEVLSHSSVGCFVSHCGWNSSLESLVSEVPMVAFLQWSDQAMNAKLIEDVWKTGVRLIKNGEGIVEAGEVKRCIEMVMGGGDRGEEMRNNANKWKDLAREATLEGGSSDKNLNALVDEVRAH